MQRIAVLTHALAQEPPDPDLTYEAMKDRVHQPYRHKLVSGICTSILSLCYRITFVDSRLARSDF
jgi:homoserine kinase